MSLRRQSRALVLLVLALMCAVAGVHAANAQSADTPYVQTPRSVVDAMLKIAGVGSSDYLIDLGSGDGRIPIAAAKIHGARGFGVDIDGALVSEARREARRQGVADRVAFHERNLFVTDIAQATVLTMYLYPQVIMRLRPRLLTELRPGTRVVSHDFDLDNWQPDDKITVPVPDKPYGPPTSNIYLWIVPADASGTWRWQLPGGAAPRNYEATFEQTFQMLDGRPLVAGRAARLHNARMRGEEISFTLTAPVDGTELRHEFRGRLAGDVITGTVQVGGMQLEWHARRAKRGKMNINAVTGLPAVAHAY
jgi:hypothetical protein